MEEITISPYRNQSQKDWVCQYRRHYAQSRSTSTVDDLIDYASSAAQQNLLALEDPACVPLPRWGYIPMRLTINQVPSTNQWGKEQLGRIAASVTRLTFGTVFEELSVELPDSEQRERLSFSAATPHGAELFNCHKGILLQGLDSWTDGSLDLRLYDCCEPVVRHLLNEPQRVEPGEPHAGQGVPPKGSAMQG
jgi:hypothetical protein